MSDTPGQIRSYQRIFRPERRIYQIDGRRLPVPGGVPLAWLLWAAGTLLVVLALSSRSLTLTLGVGFAAALAGAGYGGWPPAAVAGLFAFVCVYAAGVVLGALDWPLRLVILPAAVATLAGQVSPDGRPAHRYLLSWVALRLAPARRSLEQPVAAEGSVVVWAPEVWVAPDEHCAVLRRGRVHGPARLEFRELVVVYRRRGRHVVRRAEGHRVRRGEALAEVVEVGAGQVVEVRP
jgi:hypothetical protein